MQSAQRIPDLGRSPLEEAFENYQTMEHQLELHREELATKNDMVNDLLRENEFLRRNYDKAVAERDRYQALAVNLATRAVGVREAVERLLAEAVSAKAPPVDEGGTRGAEPVSGRLEDDLAQLMKAAAPSNHLGPIAVPVRDITRRTTLAPNEFR